MSAPDRDHSSGEPPAAGTEAGKGQADDSLRAAVERTLAATAGSASETRQRARELLDEVARRGEAAREELSRRGEAAREQVSRTRDAAREDLLRRGDEAGRRFAEAIAELAPGSAEGAVGTLGAHLEALERRVARLEHAIGVQALEQAAYGGEAQPPVEGEDRPGRHSGEADADG